MINSMVVVVVWTCWVRIWVLVLVSVLVSGLIDHSSCACSVSIGSWIDSWEFFGVIIKNSQYFILPNSGGYSYMLESGGENVSAVASACNTVIYDQTHNSLESMIPSCHIEFRTNILSSTSKSFATSLHDSIHKWFSIRTVMSKDPCYCHINSMIFSCQAEAFVELHWLKRCLIEEKMLCFSPSSDTFVGCIIDSRDEW